MDVVEHIKELCKEKGYTYYALAKNSGLQYSSVFNMLSKGTVPTIRTLEKMCKGMDITLAQFFSPNNPYIDLNGEQKELVEIYSRSPRSDKDILMAYARGLAKRL